MMFKPTKQWEFDLIEPWKLGAILATHLPPSLGSNGSDSVNQANSDAESRRYSSLVQRIKRLYSTCVDSFDRAHLDFKLCELLTAQVLVQTLAFCDTESLKFYAPILDIFTNSNVKLDLDYYFRLCHEMKWDFFAAYLISQKAVPEFVNIASTQLSQLDLRTLLVLKRCAFFFTTSARSESTDKLSNLCHSLYSQIEPHLVDDPQNKLFVSIQNVVNELFYHFDDILGQLFEYANNLDQFVAKTSESKKIYWELTRKAKTLIECIKELNGTMNADTCDLQDGFILWTSLLRHLDITFGCDLLGNHQFEPKLLTSADKYCFLQKIFCIYQCKNLSSFGMSKTQSIKNHYSFLIKLCYSLMVNSFEYYFDCPLFGSITSILQEYDNNNLDQVESLLKGDKLWAYVLDCTPNDDNFFNLFQITAKLGQQLQSNAELENRLQQLLVFTLTILMRNRLSKADYFENMFQRRVELYGVDKISCNMYMFSRNLIKEAAFSKVKVDFQVHKIKKLTLDVIFCAFVSPLDTYDTLFNSVLVFLPLNYNHLIVHLLCYHLRPLSHFKSFVDDILVSDQKLNLVESMAVLKFRQNFDIISIDSFNDFLQLLTSKSSSICFETLLANLLAYSGVRPTNLPLNWLQSICELVKHNQFKSSNVHNFTVIAAFLLKLLFNLWNDQTKKEIIIAMLRIYSCKNETKLSADQVNRIGRLVQQSIGTANCTTANFSVHYLLFYLEESFSFPRQQLLQQNAHSMLCYAAISTKSDWLVDSLATHSNYLFDRLYFVFGDIMLCLTQKELQNLIALLSKVYSKMHLILVISLILAAKLDNIDATNADSIVYFCRSLFCFVDQITNELINCQEGINKTQMFNELLYIFFVWCSIETKLGTLKGTATVGNEVYLEVRKIVQSIETHVKQSFAKWKISIKETESEYIDSTYRRFREQIKRTNDSFDCRLAHFKDGLKSYWKSQEKSITSINESK